MTPETILIIVLLSPIALPVGYFFLPSHLSDRLRAWCALQWYRFRLGKDEFHPSLDMDLARLLRMSPEKEHQYRAKLLRKRQEAHAKEERDFLKTREPPQPRT